jgi:hypothetical protein
MKTLDALFDTVRVAPRHRATLLWALVLCVSTFSAFVYTVQRSAERGQAMRQQAHALAPAEETEEFVLTSVSLATAR